MDKRANFKDLNALFGVNVFSDEVMKSRLPEKIYNELQEVLSESKELDRKLADEIAKAMKDWAIEKGATHYTHWFQPLTETTAEKHDSFIDLDKNGKVILDFSGKQLIKGEADASSFPSGGTRATFEARGYTVWDCTSPAFVRETENGSTVLCIPTAFCSYNGEALDKKTPLLRSMEALNKQGLRVLRHLGNKTTKKVLTNLGAEQEYFLIKKEHYNKRKDLIFTGRTLFGAAPPKGQELHDQYYASIRDCVIGFMNELNYELWKLGITAKTQHNEVAPSQHELAPIYETTNIATDHNQLTMELMKKIADRNGLACLLHEKPFEGVNGSGKHNNWSICTDDGINLLNPGKTPKQNTAFLVFFTSVIAAVKEYAELLRMSASHPGNDHRLGGSEAPPAIMSVFIGDELETVLDEIEKNADSLDKARQYLNTGVATLPTLKKDNSDRNRTSPFAFTGNKFEFRMVGASASTATPNVVLCTAVAEILKRIADRLDNSNNISEELNEIIKENIINSKPILYSGNNYSRAWAEEAKHRGLPNKTNCVDSYQCLTYPESISLFESHKVLSSVELKSRQEIYYENYVKTINIEALTMIAIARNEIIPAVCKYIKNLSDSINSAKTACKNLSFACQEKIVENLQNNLNKLFENVEKLNKDIIKVKASFECNKLEAEEYRDIIVPQMQTVRKFADMLEISMAKNLQPFPTYADLLFYD